MKIEPPPKTARARSRSNAWRAPTRATALLEDALDRGEQPGRVARLDDEVAGAQSARLDHGLHVPFRGQHRHPRVRIEHADLLERREPVHDLHRNVEQHRVRSHLLVHPDALAPVGGFDDLVTLVLEGACTPTPDEARVVHHQDPRHSAHLAVVGRLPSAFRIARGIAGSGWTSTAASSAIASFGIPKTTQLFSDSAIVCAPAWRIASRPFAPSAPMPVINTPIAFGPTFAATDWNRTSTLGFW